MRPEDNQQPQRTNVPQASSRSYIKTPPSRDPAYRQQEATANIVRAQIDSIYSSDDDAEQVTQAPASDTTSSPKQSPAPKMNETSTEEASHNPYDRTHSKQTTIQPEQWKAYHSAWQDYYKRYYEGYYTQQVASAKHSIEAASAKNHKQESTGAIGSAQSPAHTTMTPDDAAAAKRKEAMSELRARLLSQVETSAKKARKSKHFIPIVATLGVLFIFGFLQWNQLLIANVKAYVTPGNIDPQNIIVDPASTVEVGPEPRLIIPKINVDTPVFYDIPTDKKSQDKAMENGVGHFAIPGANSHPGEIGNTVLSGHSSNDVFAAGDYKFIFMQLDKLEKGDTIYANYEGTRYTYIVTEKKEVAPTDVKSLTHKTDKPEMTLITCTPLGTALRRLLVVAEQVYPEASKPAPESSDGGNTQTTIPGTEGSSILERMFS